SSGCATKPKAREIGWTGYAGLTQHSLRIGHYVMATAEHREPCDSRGSCTVLGAPGGEIPPGDSAVTTEAVGVPPQCMSAPKATVADPNATRRFVPLATERSAAKSVSIRSPRRRSRTGNARPLRPESDRSVTIMRPVARGYSRRQLLANAVMAASRVSAYPRAALAPRT